MSDPIAENIITASLYPGEDDDDDEDGKRERERERQTEHIYMFVCMLTELFGNLNGEDHWQAQQLRHGQQLSR